MADTGKQQQPPTARDREAAETLNDGEAAAAAAADGEVAAVETKTTAADASSEEERASDSPPAAAPEPEAETETQPEHDLAAEYFERLARLQAEFDNYRKRVRIERENDQKYGAERLATALLPVVDNLERALALIPRDEATQSWRQGIELIHRQFLDVLSKEGIVPVEASPGTVFDPNVHEAVMREASSEYESGCITAELQRGYRLHDRLLRPSLVRVAE